jgi:seryl-tRNA synthetase
VKPAPDVETCEGVAWQASGQIVLRGPLLQVLRALDATFVSWAAEWHADDVRFPVGIAAKELAKVDYFGSFPHLANFACSLDARPENLRTFAGGPHFDAEGGIALAKLAPVDQVLTPAACYHVYVDLQGCDVAAPSYVTTLANCFRRETKYEPLRRQWSFSMREIVCVAEADDVKRFLAAFEPRVMSFAKQLGIELRYEQATDPFFDPQTNPKVFSQMLDPLKREMLADDGLALGSINFHRNFFGEAFCIRVNREPAFTGCVAFGLERWVYTLLRQHGDPHAALSAIRAANG